VHLLANLDTVRTSNSQQAERELVVVLASLDKVVRLLVCPRCRSRLMEDNRGFRCTDLSCPYAVTNSFPIIGGWPVVVDFERSVLMPQVTAEWSTSREGTEVATALHRSGIQRVPRLLRGIWKPLNRVAERNVSRLLDMLPDRRSRVLVVGGGTVGNGLDRLYACGDETEVIGIDLYGSDVTQLVADAHAIPLQTGSVDAVIVQAVLEHVLAPMEVVREIHRVLADDGLVYAETPFMQQVHAGAYDFTRFTASGHRYLFRWFDEIDSGPTAGPGTQLLWSLDHLVRGLTRSQTAGRLVRALLFGLRFLDRYVDRAYSLDAASAVYFLGRRSDTEMTPTDIVAYYRGAQRD
jgi:SAM-dependent methyltransferase